MVLSQSNNLNKIYQKHSEIVMLINVPQSRSLPKPAVTAYRGEIVKKKFQNHREHTILLRRTRVNKGMKRNGYFTFNRLLLSTRTRAYRENGYLPFREKYFSVKLVPRLSCKLQIILFSFFFYSYPTHQDCVLPGAKGEIP